MGTFLSAQRCARPRARVSPLRRVGSSGSQMLLRDDGKRTLISRRIVDQWDVAAHSRNRARMVEILCALGLGSQADHIASLPCLPILNVIGFKAHADERRCHRAS